MFLGGLKRINFSLNFPSVDHASSGNETDDGADDGTDVGLVVGAVCGAAALVAVGASLAIYKFKQHPARG